MLPFSNYFDTSRAIMLFCISSILSPLTYYIQTYVFADWQFLGFLFTIIIVNTALGFWVAIKAREVSSEGYGQVIVKIVIYGAFLIMIHVLTSFTVDGEKSSLFVWIKSVGYGMLLLKEAISIVKNIGKIAPNFLPPWLLKYLTDFNDSGKLISNLPDLSTLPQMGEQVSALMKGRPEDNTHSSEGR